MDGLYQDEQVLCGWILYLAKFSTKIFDNNVMEARADLRGLFADELEALVLCVKTPGKSSSSCLTDMSISL